MVSHGYAGNIDPLGGECRPATRLGCCLPGCPELTATRPAFQWAFLYRMINLRLSTREGGLSDWPMRLLGQTYFTKPENYS